LYNLQKVIVSKKIQNGFKEKLVRKTERLNADDPFSDDNDLKCAVNAKSLGIAVNDEKEAIKISNDSKFGILVGICA
jgi:hypothetical protein